MNNEYHRFKILYTRDGTFYKYFVNISNNFYENVYEKFRVLYSILFAIFKINYSVLYAKLRRLSFLCKLKTQDIYAFVQSLNTEECT